MSHTLQNYSPWISNTAIKARLRENQDSRVWPESLGSVGSLFRMGSLTVGKPEGTTRQAEPTQLTGVDRNVTKRREAQKKRVDQNRKTRCSD